MGICGVIIGPQGDLWGRMGIYRVMWALWGIYEDVWGRIGIYGVA